MRRVDRRRFLRLAALGAASAGALACGSRLPAPPSAATEPTPTGGGRGAGGAAQFKEAPALAALVRAGALPPVGERLPAGPRTITPRERVGQYGGTWRRAYAGLSDVTGFAKLVEEHLIEWDAPDPDRLRLVPNFLERWQQSREGTAFTFYFRKGARWSDGAEVTTEDTRFWLEDIQKLRDLAPVPSFLVTQRVGGQLRAADVTILDRYVVEIRYPQPNPLLPMRIAKSGGGSGIWPGLVAPSHYLKQFHPRYTQMSALDRFAVELSRRSQARWLDLWGRNGDMNGLVTSWFRNPELPVLGPWKIARPYPADPIVMERNPYYWQVDTAGNQLPYVDAVAHTPYVNAAQLKQLVAEGKIDMQLRGMDVGNLAFYRANEATGGYRVLEWRTAATDCYFPNVNCPDPVLAKLFDAPAFRQALNLAIDRHEINARVWNGLGRPRQYGPSRGSPEHDEGMEKAWAAYDPRRANDLLDGLGLPRGADGTRLRPDGAPLTVTIAHATLPGSTHDRAHDMVAAYWRAIGVAATTRAVTRAQYEEDVLDGDVEIGFWPWDRTSANMADPGRWLGTIADGPWAPKYGRWYAGLPGPREEPPPDHPIRELWQLWDRLQAEPDEARRQALFQEIVALHRQAPVAVGTVGEKVAPVIVANNVRNVGAGYLADDTLRDEGLMNPQQLYFSS